MRKILYSLVFVITGTIWCYAQDNLLGDLIKEEATKPKQNITTATFKGTRLINSQTTEIVGAGNLEFMVAHRFSSFTTMRQGNWYRFLGLNAANTYLTLNYTPIRWLNIGVNYSFPIIDGNLKFQLLRQQTGIHNIPISVVLFVDAFLQTGPFSTYQGSYKGGQNPAGRFSYLWQLLAARKFNDAFSLQIMPTWVHFNSALVSAPTITDIWSIGLGGRYKITQRIAITAEYFRQLNGYLASTNGYTNYEPDIVSVGAEFDTGGHIFQVFLTNSAQVISPGMFNTNTTPFWKGDIRIGFNLNRTFGIAKKKSKPLE